MANIVAVRLSSLGDVVLAQPVLTALAAAGHRVELLTQPEYGPLGEMFPGVSRVITAPGDAAGFYDVILDLHGTGRSHRWLKLLRGARRVQYPKHALARRLLVRPGGHPVFWNAWSTLQGNETVTDWYAQAARFAGLEAVLQPARLEIPEAAQAQAGSVLSLAGISSGEKWAAMVPGARWATKQWPKEAFAELAERLEAETGLRTVLLGGPGEEGLGREIAGMAGPGTVSLAGQTRVQVLAAMLSRASLFIGNDSGPLHLAMAAGAPVLAFFGPTVPEFGFAPRESRRVSVLKRELACRPCSLHGSRRCPLGHHRCLRDIDVPSALAESKKLLDWPDSSR